MGFEGPGHDEWLVHRERWLPATGNGIVQYLPCLAIERRKVAVYDLVEYFRYLIASIGAGVNITISSKDLKKGRNNFDFAILPSDICGRRERQEIFG